MSDEQQAADGRPKPRGQTQDEKARDEIRASILGGDRPFQSIPGARPLSGKDDDDPDASGLTALGHANGQLHLLDVSGQHRVLSDRDLRSRSGVRLLFLGDEKWLRVRFPARSADDDDGGGGSKVTGFNLNLAGAWLQKFCCERGIFSDAVKLRGQGVWVVNGRPVVNAGNAVLAEGIWHKPGFRWGDQYFLAGSPLPRPSMACDAGYGREMAEDIQRLWKFRVPGAPQMLVGAIATSMLGAFVPWRVSLLLTGETGGGKSSLHTVGFKLCAHAILYNDSTAAGLAGKLSGRSQPAFVDEVNDRAGNVDLGRQLLDMMLTSAGGDGTRKVRGRPDTTSQASEFVTTFVYASVVAPPMEPQHFGRALEIEVIKPEGGEDNADEHKALAERAEAIAPHIWARMLSAADRWMHCFKAFREAARASGCAPRECDAIASPVAGWFVLCHEGLPSEQQLLEGMGLAAGFVRRSGDVAAESAPRRALDHLFAHQIQYDGTTRREQIGRLFDNAIASSDVAIDRHMDAITLGKHGVRPVRPCRSMFEWNAEDAGWRRRAQPDVSACRKEALCSNCRGPTGKAIPRCGVEGGIWLNRTAAAPLFESSSALNNGRWFTHLCRIGMQPEEKVKVGGANPVKCLFVPCGELRDE